MTTTTIINLFGGAGVGKSTTAALLFAEMKIRGLHVELVREYVKLWAWSGRKVRPEDQLYLLGKQSAYESALYGKVDYIVTDSPVFLAGAYAEWQSGQDGKYVGIAADNFIELSKKSGNVYKNYVLTREKPYDPRGRWGTASEAEEFDWFLAKLLRRHGHSFTAIPGHIRQKVGNIMLDLDLGRG